MRSGSEGGGEDERVEFRVPPLDLLRLLVFFGDRGILGEESENVEFCLDVRAGHDVDGKDKREGEKMGEDEDGNGKKKNG